MAAQLSLGRLLFEWRQHNRLSRAHVAAFLAVTPKTVACWEAGATQPPRGLELRLTEMMRPDSAQQLALHKHVVQQYSSFVALIDFVDMHLVAASRGLQSLWPEFCSLIGQPVSVYLTAEAGALMADRTFVRRVKQGDIVQVSGTSERYGAEAAGTETRHHWSASYKAYATCLIAEVWYNPRHASEPLGVLEITTFQQAVAN